MSQMTWLLVDLVKINKEIKSSSYESPDTRGTRNDHESVTGFRWIVRGSLDAGDRKVSYWIAPAVQSQISEASGRLYGSTGNQFLQLIFREDVFVPLNVALSWSQPSNDSLSWLGAPTKLHWQVLVDSGFKPEFITGSNTYQSFCGGGSESSEQYRISLVLFWPTAGSFGRAEPADVYHPTLHGVSSGDLKEVYGAPSVLGKKSGEAVPKRLSLSVNKL